MAPWLSERLGQPVVIENRPGASSNISVQAVAQSAPDGYTLLFVPASASVNVSLFDGLSFNLLRDIAPVSGLIDFPLVMVANPALPAKTVAELIALAKASPGKLSLASFGTGSTSHVAGELFKMMAGIDMTHVPFRGTAPALQSLLGGQVQLMFASMPATLEHVRAGRLVALGVTTPKRSDVLPDVPAVSEFLPGFDAEVYYGIGAPKGTPAEIVERLNKEINAGLADPSLTARFAELGGAVLPGTPEDFAKFIASETEKWGRVIKFANIKGP